MKIILIYVALVGVLLAVLLGILRIGEKLNAPINVSGEWSVNGDFAKAANESCISITFQKKEPLLVIEQSGIYLKALFNDSAHTEMQGRLQNNKMVFSKTFKVKNDSAKVFGNEQLAELSVSVTRNDDNADELTGEWKIPNISRHGSIKFNAVKNVKE
jgi:hypothetical protein